MNFDTTNGQPFTYTDEIVVKLHPVSRVIDVEYQECEAVKDGSNTTRVLAGGKQRKTFQIMPSEMFAQVPIYDLATGNEIVGQSTTPATVLALFFSCLQWNRKGRPSPTEQQPQQ